MTLNAIPGDRQLALAPLDEKADHVRGSPAAPLILEYGDYECPYSRQAFHAIEQVEQRLGGNVRFAFRHFPLTGIHPHALAAAAAAEAAALQAGSGTCASCCSTGKRRSKTATCAAMPPGSAWTSRPSTATRPAPRSPTGSAATSTAAWLRARCFGTPTLFIDGVVHRGGYDPPTLLAALAP